MLNKVVFVKFHNVKISTALSWEFLCIFRFLDSKAFSIKKLIDTYLKKHKKVMELI